MVLIKSELIALLRYLTMMGPALVRYAKGDPMDVQVGTPRGSPFRQQLCRQIRQGIA